MFHNVKMSQFSIEQIMHLIDVIADDWEEENGKWM